MWKEVGVSVVYIVICYKSIFGWGESRFFLLLRIASRFVQPDTSILTRFELESKKYQIDLVSFFSVRKNAKNTKTWSIIFLTLNFFYNYIKYKVVNHAKIMVKIYDAEIRAATSFFVWCVCNALLWKTWKLSLISHERIFFSRRCRSPWM